MKVRRIVANIATPDVARAKRFYQELLGLDLLMDHGWIATYGADTKMEVQLSIASQGGSGTPTPDLSIEVDDIDQALERMRAAGVAIEYGPAGEPWGVRRFYVRDPFGKLVSILAHRRRFDRGQEGFRLPALRTVCAVFSHTALQLAVSTSGVSRCTSRRMKRAA